MLAQLDMFVCVYVCFFEGGNYMIMFIHVCAHTGQGWISIDFLCHFPL